MTDDPWRIDVTDADIRAAKRAWIAARDSDATDAEVARLHEVLRLLMQAEAQQIAEDFRIRIGASTPDAD